MEAYVDRSNGPRNGTDVSSLAKPDSQKRMAAESLVASLKEFLSAVGLTMTSASSVGFLDTQNLHWNNAANHWP